MSRTPHHPNHHRNPPSTVSSSPPHETVARHARDVPYQSPSRTSSGPMAIWQPVQRATPPPPLPPPTRIPELYVGQDLAWRWANDTNASDFGRLAPVKPGSSLLGLAGQLDPRYTNETVPQHPRSQAQVIRRGSSIAASTQARDHEMSDANNDAVDFALPPISLASSNRNLRSERQLEQWTREESSKSYDTQLLSRIGGPNQPNHPKRPSVTSSPQDHQVQASGQSELALRRNPLRPLGAPSERTPGGGWPQTTSNDSGSSSTLPSLSGAISPGFPGSRAEHGPLDSRFMFNNGPTFDDGAGVASTTHGQHGAYDHAMFAHEDITMADSSSNSFHHYDRNTGSPRAGGVKRRASSPPRERDREREREDSSSFSSASGHSDLVQRRGAPPPQQPSRDSPVSRFHHPTHSSLSSASSYGPRHGSMSSSMGLGSIPSSVTSYNSGRISPSTASPVPDGFYAGSGHSVGQSHHHHQRTQSESTQGVGCRKMSASASGHSRHLSFTNTMESIFVCECCPKKPKKFDSEEALRQHEAEKQYMCAYCSNRFKNKNEAERHQNSLHLRLHSWSCSTLSGPEAAFHSSLYGNGSDSCGYCGHQFPNPPQWDVRAEHLSSVHKFRECNPTKKFFRADHFRQHLKHSHQGTSGKWTNMLENACMQDEPQPTPLGSDRGASITGRSGGIASPLDETPNDS